MWLIKLPNAFCISSEDDSNRCLHIDTKTGVCQEDGCPLKVNVPPKVKLMNLRCVCTDGGQFSLDDVRFNPDDNKCECGIKVHHNHCKNCGCVVQTG